MSSSKERDEYLPSQVDPEYPASVWEYAIDGLDEHGLGYEVFLDRCKSGRHLLLKA